MTLRQDFGSRIKEIRMKSKLTQSDLAERIGIDAKHMSHIETGRSFPKADLIEQFSRELNTPIPELFNFKFAKSKKDLLNEIVKMLNSASDKDVEKIYKIIVAYLK